MAAILDFSYLARRSSHDTRTLQEMDAALSRFHALRYVFVDVGVRPDGFSLPRQHALVHYVRSIQLFSSPNGLCSSITESKHITAVKIPWRGSSRYNAIGQMLRTNTHRAQIAAMRTECGRRGMLQDDVYTHTMRQLNLPVLTTQAGLDARFRDEHDAVDVEGDRLATTIALGGRPSMSHSHVLGHLLSNYVIHLAYVRRLEDICLELALPRLHEGIRRYLYDYLFPELEPGDAVPLENCPTFSTLTRLGIYHSLSVTFYAPSEISGPGGMHREMVRSNPVWYGLPRHDTVLVHLDPDRPGMEGMLAARIQLIFTFTFQDITHSCAYVEWFTPQEHALDPVTGMWKVTPEVVGGRRAVGVIDINTIVRACHLQPVHDNSKMPYGFHFCDTLDAFHTYYVNKYIDYHTHEMYT